MSGEEKVYTEGEMKLLLELKVIRSSQESLCKTFSNHVKDDEEHFDRLYASDKEILDKLNLIPKTLSDCSDNIKDEIMLQSRREFTKETDFQVFKAKIMTGIILGITIGSAVATIVSLIISASKILH